MIRLGLTIGNVWHYLALLHQLSQWMIISGCRVLGSSNLKCIGCPTTSDRKSCFKLAPETSPEAGRRTLIPEPLLKPWMLSVRREDWRPVAVKRCQCLGSCRLSSNGVHAPTESWFGALMCERISHTMVQRNELVRTRGAAAPLKVGRAVKGLSRFAPQPVLLITHYHPRRDPRLQFPNARNT